MQIHSNSLSFTQWMNYSQNVSDLRQSLVRLSSGMLPLADDPSAVVISARMLAQAERSAAAGQNLQGAISYAQTADAYLQQVQDVLGRMGELAVSAADETKTEAELDALQEEFAQYQQELTAIVADSTYNDIVIFNQAALTIQSGPDSGQTLTISGMALTTALTTPAASGGGAGALADSLATTPLSKVSADVTAASDAVSLLQATLGAQQAAARDTLDAIDTYETNLRSAASQMGSVDVAGEMVNYYSAQMRVEAGLAMIAQANVLSQSVLKLVEPGW
jgi:flagellin